MLTSSFEVDFLLKRTVLHTIPVWELDKIVASKMFLIPDICVALVTYCSRETVPGDKVRKFSNCVNSILILWCLHSNSDQGHLVIQKSASALKNSFLFLSAVEKCTPVY